MRNFPSLTSCNLSILSHFIINSFLIKLNYFHQLYENIFSGYRRIDNRVDIGPVRRHVGATHLRHFYNAGEQYKRLGGVCVLAAGYRRYLRRKFQGAKRHELQLAAGAGHEGAGSATRSMHQRFTNAARSDAEFYQHTLAYGRVGAELFRPADCYTY